MGGVRLLVALLGCRGRYEWSLVMDFNRGPVGHRGAGIVLHVNGSGTTAGCVSAPRWFIHRLIGRIDAGKNPVVAVDR